MDAHGRCSFEALVDEHCASDAVLRRLGAVLAVRDVLGIYAPNPDLVADSLELEQAVRAAAVTARENGLARDQLVADLDRISTATIPYDRVGAAHTRHTMTKWAKDAFDHDRPEPG